jgi:hypothetical protein
MEPVKFHKSTTLRVPRGVVFFCAKEAEGKANVRLRKNSGNIVSGKYFMRTMM